MLAHVEPTAAELAYLDTLPDADLVRRLKSGRDDALGVLLRRHSDALYRFCYHLMQNRDDAEDIAQETMARAIVRADGLQSGSAFRSWLFTIARNLSVDSYRARKRLTTLPDEDESSPIMLYQDSPYERVETKEEYQTVAEALGKLAKSHQTVLMMREIQGMSYAEIAQRLDVSQSAVETLLFRARRRLREEYTRTSGPVPTFTLLGGLRSLLSRTWSPFSSGAPLAAKVAAGSLLAGAVVVTTPRAAHLVLGPLITHATPSHVASIGRQSDSGIRQPTSPDIGRAAGAVTDRQDSGSVGAARIHHSRSASGPTFGWPTVSARHGLPMEEHGVKQSRRTERTTASANPPAKRGSSASPPERTVSSLVPPIRPGGPGGHGNGASTVETRGSGNAGRSDLSGSSTSSGPPQSRSGQGEPSSSSGVAAAVSLTPTASGSSVVNVRATAQATARATAQATVRTTGAGVQATVESAGTNAQATVTAVVAQSAATVNKAGGQVQGVVATVGGVVKAVPTVLTGALPGSSPVHTATPVTTASTPVVKVPTVVVKLSTIPTVPVPTPHLPRVP